MDFFVSLLPQIPNLILLVVAALTLVFLVVFARKYQASQKGLGEAIQGLEASYVANPLNGGGIFPSLTVGRQAPPAGSVGDVLVSAGALPDTVRISGGRIYNSFGGTIGVGGNYDSFWIVYTNVPQEVCLKVAPQIGGSWMGAQINSNAFVDTETESFPVDTANSQCMAGTSNTIAVQSR